MNIDPTQLYSVRASIKISSHTEKIINKLTNKYDITQKELLLTLMMKYPEITTMKEGNNMYSANREPKTKVLANQVLQFLDSRAKKLGVSKDDIFQALILQAEEDSKMEKVKLREAQNSIQNLLGTIEEKRKDISEMLGDHHPIVTRMITLEVITDNLTSSIDSHLQHNSPIDPDDFSDSGTVSVKAELVEEERNEEQDNSREYLKIYKSNVSNTSKSLDVKIPSSRIDHLMPSEKREVIKQYPSLHYWDFGVRASKYLEPGDTVWILTGETLYRGKLLTLIEDESGNIGDEIGWARQFEQPWKNVAALIDVVELHQIPQELKPYINGYKDSLQSNFYKVV